MYDDELPVPTTEPAEPAPAALPRQLDLRMLFFLISFIGTVTCWTLLVAYQKDSPLLGVTWLCGQSGVDGYGCSGVFASRYGRVLGVPLPAYGLGYFLMLMLWTIVFGRRMFNLLLGMMLTCAAAGSAFLLYILFSVLTGWCGWCLIVHAINLLTVIIGWIGCVRAAPAMREIPFTRILAPAIVIGVMMLAIAGWVGAWYQSQRAKTLEKTYIAFRTNDAFLRWIYDRQPQRTITINEHDHQFGAADADIDVVIYKDFQCPFCADAWKGITEFVKGYAARDRVRIVVRHWPFSKECNAGVTSNSHPYACAAARAAEAVAAIAGPNSDAFWKYHQLLIDNHDRLDTSPYADLAAKLGIDRRTFATAYTSPELAAHIQRDIASAQTLKIHGVPTIFVNGRSIDQGWRSREFLTSLFDDLLGRSPTTAPTVLPTTHPVTTQPTHPATAPTSAPAGDTAPTDDANAEEYAPSTAGPDDNDNAAAPASARRDGIDE